MSSSTEFADLSGQRQAKAPEKHSFSQKCSMLSQYLKEKGSFGDLTLGMTCNIEGNGTFCPFLKKFIFNWFFAVRFGFRLIFALNLVSGRSQDCAARRFRILLGLGGGFGRRVVELSV
jgi:hypothetical protein